MRFLKKWGTLLVSLFFIGAIAVLVVMSKKSIDELKQAVADRDTQIGTLETAITDIGELQNGYVLNTAVRAGEPVNVEYFNMVSVPTKLGLDLVTSLDGMEDAYFRVSLPEQTVLTQSEINYDEVQDSERYVDIVLDQLPVGVRAGDYIDIRITFPYGEDFIAITSKKIEEINNSIIKLRLNENEIQIYNSLLLDRVVYGGTQIYAVTYVDAGSQEIAEAFYPINNDASELLLNNPNALEISKQEMILKRQAVEETLGGGLSEKTEDEIQRINDSIENIRIKTQDKVISANEVINQRREAEAEAAAREAAGEGTSSEGKTVSF